MQFKNDALDLSPKALRRELLVYWIYTALQ